MQVKIIPQLTYRVETDEGVHVGDFVKADEWQGMTRLTGGSGKSLIVESMSWTEEVLSRMFNDTPEPRTAEVVKGSPDVLHTIAKRRQDRT